MMCAKDARVGLMGELLRHLGIVKALGWEDVIQHKVWTQGSNTHRGAGVFWGGGG